MNKHILRHAEERHRVRDSKSYFFMTKDPEMKPGNMLLGVEDPGIIQGSTLSKHTGPPNHTRLYTF